MMDWIGLLVAVIVAIWGSHHAMKTQKRRSLDGNTLLKLEDCGIDLSQPQALEFWFYADKQSAIDKVAEELEQRGFQVYLSDTGDEPRYVIRAIKEMLPELSQLQQLRKEFNRLSRSNGAEYDGWGCSMPDSTLDSASE